MKKLLSLLFLWPLLAQAQISTYSLTWDSVPVSPATNVVGYCSINNGTSFQAVTVPTIQNGADVIVDLTPGSKIACIARTTDGSPCPLGTAPSSSCSPESNIAVAYEPMQITAQLCVAAGSGTWKSVGGPIFSLNPLKIYGGWMDLQPQPEYQVVGVAYRGMPCGDGTLMQIGNYSYHAVLSGMTVCVLQ